MTKASLEDALIAWVDEATEGEQRAIAAHLIASPVEHTTATDRLMKLAYAIKLERSSATRGAEE